MLKQCHNSAQKCVHTVVQHASSQHYTTFRVRETGLFFFLFTTGDIIIEFVNKLAVAVTLITMKI